MSRGGARRGGGGSDVKRDRRACRVFFFFLRGKGRKLRRNSVLLLFPLLWHEGQNHKEPECERLPSDSCLVRGEPTSLQRVDNGPDRHRWGGEKS